MNGFIIERQVENFNYSDCENPRPHVRQNTGTVTVASGTLGGDSDHLSQIANLKIQMLLTGVIGRHLRFMYPRIVMISTLVRHRITCKETCFLLEESIA